jgi:hypothetical protein
MSNYRIAEVLKFLDIGRDQLFYWIRTKRLIQLEEEGKGRGKRSLLSIKNIIELALAKDLVNIGIELTFVKDILQTRIRPSEDQKISIPLVDFICNEYRDKGRDYPKYYLFINKDENNEYQFYPIWYLRKMELGNIMDSFREKIGVLLVVDVFKILERIETKTGEKV